MSVKPLPTSTLPGGLSVEPPGLLAPHRRPPNAGNRLTPGRSDNVACPRDLLLLRCCCLERHPLSRTRQVACFLLSRAHVGSRPVPPMHERPSRRQAIVAARVHPAGDHGRGRRCHGPVGGNARWWQDPAVLLGSRHRRARAAGWIDRTRQDKVMRAADRASARGCLPCPASPERTRNLPMWRRQSARQPVLREVRRRSLQELLRLWSVPSGHRSVLHAMRLRLRRVLRRDARFRSGESPSPRTTATFVSARSAAGESGRVVTPAGSRGMASPT